jgi:transcriptional regulator with XRE-family HTH domain
MVPRNDLFGERQKMSSETPPEQRRQRGRPPKPIVVQKTPVSRLGRALRQAREAAGFSLTGFAEVSTYSAGHLSRVEHGVETPSRELVNAYEARCETDGLLCALYAMVLDAQREDRFARRRASDGPPPFQQKSSKPRTQPGDRSEFVADLTLPDGSIVTPGARLLKRWRLRNAGSVTWRGRSLERIGASIGPAAITSPRLVPIADTNPGESVDIEIEVEAPALPGSTIAYWQMVDTKGRPCFPDRYADGIYVQLVVR